MKKSPNQTDMGVIQIGDTVALRNKAGEPLGELTVEVCRYGAWCGKFAPAPGYDCVRALFVEWTKLVDDQCFSLADAINDKISRIGISAFRNNEPLHVTDVQIYDEGDQISGCFREVA